MTRTPDVTEAQRRAQAAGNAGRSLMSPSRDDTADIPEPLADLDTGDDALPGVNHLLNELAKLTEKAATKRRVHEVIRLLARTSAQTQHEYRDAITGKGYVTRGDWREALSEAKKNRPKPQGEQKAVAAGPVLPQDALDISEEPKAVRAITEAISSGRFHEVYLRGDQLAQVTTTEKGVLARDLDEAVLRRLIADHLLCVRLNRKLFIWEEALPLPMTCKAILALPQWPKVRRLRGVATFPVPLPDGTVLQQPGYDDASGLYLREGLGVRPVPDKPSKKEITAALDFLLGKFLRDFPWTSDADKANALAMFLTPLLREIINDVFPFPYITAPERGSGKSLLAALAKILYGGSMRTLPKKEEEVEKTITSALRGAAPVIIFDNVPQDITIKSPSLAAVLTMREWTARILGGSRDGTWPNDRLWMATGTNIALGGDFAQRSVRIAMDYGKPDPDRRRGFAIPELESWTAAHRGEVLWYLLVIIRAWQVAGAKRDTQHIMRGYTPWAQVLGGLMAFHQVDGFLANRDEVVGQDEDAAEMAAFLRMLKSRYDGKGHTARQILDDAAADARLREALPSTLDGGPYTTKSLGKLLSGHEGKWYGKPKLTLRRKRDHSEISYWRVEEWQA